MTQAQGFENSPKVEGYRPETFGGRRKMSKHLAACCLKPIWTLFSVYNFGHHLSYIMLENLIMKMETIVDCLQGMDMR